MRLSDAPLENKDLARRLRGPHFLIDLPLTKLYLQNPEIERGGGFGTEGFRQKKSLDHPQKKKLAPNVFLTSRPLPFIPRPVRHSSSR